MNGLVKIIAALFFVLTPLFLIEVYPDVNGRAPIAIWLICWFTLLAVAFSAGRLKVIKRSGRVLTWENFLSLPGYLKYPIMAAVTLAGILLAARVIVFAGFVYLIMPVALIINAVIALAAGLAIRRSIWPVISFFLFVWLCSAFSLAYVRLPSSVWECKSLELPDDVKSLIDVDKIAGYPELEGSLPYEARRDGDSLLVTFKNLSGQGTLARFFLDDRPPQFMKTVNRRYPWMMMYPERICLDRQHKIVYSTTKTYRHFEIFRADYSGEQFIELPPIPTPDRETTNCIWDERNQRLAVLFLRPEIAFAFYGFPQGVSGPAEMIDPIYRSEKDIFADYMTLDRAAGRVYVATGWYPENKLTAIDLDEGRVEQHLLCNAWFGCLHPLGIDMDQQRQRFYLSDPINSSVAVLDAESFGLLQTVKVSRFPRKITYDKNRDLVYTASYAGGTVDELSAEPLRRVRSIRLGRLVRSVAFDEVGGETIAVSSCGIFAIGGLRPED